MLVARELLAAGASVHIVERGESGREASWAGGGIVSPLYPWRYVDAVSALANAAQDTYSELAKALISETGIDPEFSQCGLTMLDTQDSADALAWAKRYQRQMTLWDRQQIYDHESGLTEGYEQALWMPRVANIRNPRLLKALRRAVVMHPGATLSEQCEVVNFHRQGTRLTHVAVKLNGRMAQLTADRFVLTAGAWSGMLLEGIGVHLPVVPVKGQMLLYRAEKPLLTGIVLSQGRYLIPRQDNHILVGSTLEHTGFDKHTSSQALDSLRASAVAMLPALGSLPVVQQWAGLRPGAPEGIPFIGLLPGCENLYVNAGHYRNGLVLAPASARLLADLMLGRKPAIDPAPYDPEQRIAAIQPTGFASDPLIAENTRA